MEEYSIETRAIHVGQEPENWSTLAVIPPISLATTFKQPYPGNYEKFDYSRSGNPTRDCLEQALATLEGAKYGLAFSSGLAAISTIVSLLKSGEHFICADDVYGGTCRLLRSSLNKINVKLDFVDITNVNNIISSITESTRIVWLESPTNPTFKICDLNETVKRIRSLNRPDIIICVDNTFMTPIFQKPLNFKVDLVVHSISKYINGHSDVIMGCILTNNEELYKQLTFLQNAIGCVPSPFDCFLVNRGLKTLPIRMEKHQSNALKIAQFLELHPKIEKVIYPGLKSHLQHDLCLKQCSGFSGMLSFYIKGSSENASKLVSNLKIITLAESLGAIESLIEIPSKMTHMSVPEELRIKLGITDGLVRLSVGIENVDDLINDLKQSLETL